MENQLGGYYLIRNSFNFQFYRLKILDAKLSDSGNYTCMPTSAEASSVMVHVLNGKLWWKAGVALALHMEYSQ